MVQRFRYEQFIGLFLIFFALNISAAKADYVNLQCIEGDCSIPFFAQEDDFAKVLSNQNSPELDFAVDSRPLTVADNFTKSFKVLLYEVNDFNEKVVLASTDLTIPKGKRNQQRLFFQVNIPPFTGDKEIFIALHKSDGTWAATHKGLYSFRGDFTQSQSAFSPSSTDLSLNSNLSTKLQSSSIECDNENFNDCNLDSLFFNRIQFEIVPRTQAKKVNVRKSADGIYKGSRPVKINLTSLEYA
ncbi:MAG: hypothetical protein HRT47_05665 [Candidatus Caenarcaniphilales bacterium]|nr:hypothetical protein [Candidatus Caenarcaniphilales bacterium]